MENIDLIININDFTQNSIRLKSWEISEIYVKVECFVISRAPTVLIKKLCLILLISSF